MNATDWVTPAASACVAILVPYLTFQFTRAQTDATRRLDRRAQLYRELLTAMSLLAEQAEQQGSTLRTLPEPNVQSVISEADFRRVVAGIHMFGSREVKEIYQRFRAAITDVAGHDRVAEVLGMAPGSESDVMAVRLKAREASQLALGTFRELEEQIEREFEPRPLLARFRGRVSRSRRQADAGSQSGSQ